jgi:hypothetical protein
MPLAFHLGYHSLPVRQPRGGLQPVTEFGAPLSNLRTVAD